MKNKILLLGLVVLSIVMCTSAVSAYTSYSSFPQIVKGASPYYPYVTVGGRQATGGVWASSYFSNLIPGTYYGTPCNSGSSIAYYDASRPCNGGRSWFGGYSGYNGGSYGWGGAWGGYNTYGGNVGWAARSPSYGYNYNGYV
jgi:hypothetical protein